MKPYLRVQLAVCLGLAGGLAVAGDDGPALNGGKQVVEGQCLDATGRPPGEGWIFFRPNTAQSVFTRAWAARLDPAGRYRLELVGDPHPTATTGARVSDPLIYEVLAPGFRTESGPAVGGTTPVRVDVRLEALPWRETEIRCVDAQNRPVAGVAIGVEMAARNDWSQGIADAEGRCRIVNPPNRVCGIHARREGWLPTVVLLNGEATDSPLVFIPLREPIRGRVVDAGGQPLAGIQIGAEIISDLEGADPQAPSRLNLFAIRGLRDAITTDADGQFTLSPPIRLEPTQIDRSGHGSIRNQALCFADPSFRRLAFQNLSWNQPPARLDVSLLPTRPVRLPLTHAVAVPPGGLQIRWQLSTRPEVGKPYPVMEVTEPSPTGDEIVAHWPAGSYQL